MTPKQKLIEAVEEMEKDAMQEGSMLQYKHGYMTAVMHFQKLIEAGF
jgi:hypothetical protein